MNADPSPTPSTTPQIRDASASTTGGESSTIQISAAVAAKIGFASHQNSVALVRDLAVSSADNTAYADVVLELTADPPFLTPKSWRIDRLDAGATLQISDRDVKLDASLLNNLTEAVRGTVCLRLTKGAEVLASHQAPVELLSRSEWGGASTMAELLPAFVLPNDPAIDRLLKATSEVLRRAGKPDAINGYESKSRKRVWSLAAALWSAVAGKRFTYALPPASFERQGQKIRTPSAILDGHVATCLDTALLFAAALEQMGMYPLIILCKGHAFTGLWLEPREFADIAVDEAASLRKRIDLEEMIVFETTLATQAHPADFNQAIDTALRLLDSANDADFEAAIDVHRARLQHIKPLPTTLAKIPGAEGEPAEISIGLAEAPNLPDFDEDISKTAEAAGQITDRLLVWQRKLLDLTSRNRLLNLPEGSNSIALLCPDPAFLEDRMAGGKAIKLLPMPQLDVGGRAIAKSW